MQHSHKSFSLTILTDIVHLFPAIFSFFISKFVSSIVWGIYLNPDKLALLILFLNIERHISTLFTGWLRQASIRFLPENKNYILFFAVNSLIIVTPTAFLGFIFLIYLNNHSQLSIYLSANYILLISLIYFISSFFLLFQIFLRGLFETFIFSFTTIIQDCLRFCLFLLFLPFSNDHIFHIFIAIIISYSVAITFQIRKLRFYLIESFSDKSLFLKLSFLKKSFYYGFPLSISLFLVNLSLVGDRYVLVHFLSLQELGIYAFWMMIGLQLIRGSNQLLFMAINPRLYQKYATNEKQALYYTKLLLNFYFIYSIPCIVFIGFCIPHVLQFLNIKSEYLHSWPLIFFGMGMGFFIALAQLIGKQRELSLNVSVFAYSSFISALSMFLFVFILVILYGFYGAAFGALFGSCIYFLIISFVTKNWPSVSCVYLSFIFILIVSLTRFVCSFYTVNIFLFLLFIEFIFYCIYIYFKFGSSGFSVGGRA